ncbi:MAG TPA: M2 family metallopeptidase [Candidatus Polarisedimenticolia bacterium]|nr:M2 family metallopeptidase [Candidatus Polarisedimenticolia bacterium]
MKFLIIMLLSITFGLSWAVAQEKLVPADAPDAEARIFMDMFEAGFKNFSVGMSEEYWKFYTRGDPGRTELFEKLQSEILSDAKTFEKLKAWNGKIADPPLARRVDLLYRTFALAQVTSQEKIYTLQNSLQKVQINFRSTYQGKPASQNQLTNLLRFEKDRGLRKEAWASRNQVGTQMAPDLTRLIRLRNEEARRLGYKSFYDMSLALGEIDEGWLFKTLGDLERLSREPYAKWKARVQKLIHVERLEPWDTAYDYDNFQEKLKAYFPKQQILPRLKRTYRGIGFDIEKMPILVDDEERPGKSQHAFSFSIEVPTDIRILANADDGVASYRTLFHEMGHAVYSASIQQPSFLLQDAASACFTEGIGQFFPLLLEDEKWLTSEAGVPLRMAREFKRKLREDAAYGVRFYLVILNFEREAYANPEQNLTRLWWAMNEKYLGLPPHTEVDSWASIIHFTSHPAYYQNYLLADMIAAQLMHHLESQQGSVLDNAKTGEFLRESVFAKGASVAWRRLLSDTTGEDLNVKYYVEERLGATRARASMAKTSLSSD